MGAPLAACLDGALRDVRSFALAVDGDPLRLELPPDTVGDDRLELKAAAVLGSLYLLSELEQLGVVACAELLAAERWNLGVRDASTAQRLDAYATEAQRRPNPATRAQLYSRLFGAPVDTSVDTGLRMPGGPVHLVPPAGNDVFEELLAGYCDAIMSYNPRALPRVRSGLRLAGDRLRANLAPRQYGSTMIVATPLVEQLRSSLDLLSLNGLGDLFHVSGAWAVVRAMQPADSVDIGRRVDRGQSGRTVVASTGYPSAPDLLDAPLSQAADVWLTATGFGEHQRGG